MESGTAVEKDAAGLRRRVGAFVAGLGAVAVTLAQGSVGPAADSRAEAIRHKLEDSTGGIMVVAHRGCHNASAPHKMLSAPENSLVALEHCVRLGVDIMEADVRRSKDGALIIMHDATVNRTTNGTGRVADLTLVGLKRLRLRENSGGATARVLGTQRVPTLRELLAAAAGRILLNLDIEDDIHPQVIAAIVAAGMARGVLVKSFVSEVQHPVADQLPYSQVPYMPVVIARPGPGSTDLAAVAAAQIAAAHRVSVVEAVDLTEAEFSAVAATTRWGGVRLWVNTLPGAGLVSIVTKAGDLERSHDDDRAWSKLRAHGATVFQTDEPGALIDYIRGREGREPQP